MRKVKTQHLGKLILLVSAVLLTSCANKDNNKQVDNNNEDIQITNEQHTDGFNRLYVPAPEPKDLETDEDATFAEKLGAKQKKSAESAEDGNSEPDKVVGKVKLNIEGEDNELSDYTFFTYDPAQGGYYSKFSKELMQPLEGFGDMTPMITQCLRYVCEISNFKTLDMTCNQKFASSEDYTWTIIEFRTGDNSYSVKIAVNHDKDIKYKIDF